MNRLLKVENIEEVGKRTMMLKIEMDYEPSTCLVSSKYARQIQVTLSCSAVAPVLLARSDPAKSTKLI